MSKESKLETGCFCEVYDGRTLKNITGWRMPDVLGINCADVSRCENFLLIISKVGSIDGTHEDPAPKKNRILVFDISTSRLLAESVVNCEITSAKFNPSGTSNNKEFLLLGDKKIFFWRLKNNNNLQYQEISIKNPGAVIDMNFTCFDFIGNFFCVN